MGQRTQIGMRKFQLDLRKSFLSMKTLKKQFFPFLEIFKARRDRTTWSDIAADPALNRRFDQRPCEVPSSLGYPVTHPLP